MPHRPSLSPLLPLRPFARWWSAGLRLARRAPFRIFVASLLPLLIEALLQLIPSIGMLLSKLLTPLFASGSLVALSRLDLRREWRWSDLISAFSANHRARAFRWSLLMSVVWLSQSAIALVLYGTEGLRALLLGERISQMATPAFALAVILPGLVLSIPLMISGPLLILEGRGATDSLRSSLRWAVRFWPSVLSYAMASALLFSAGLALSPLILLVGIPLLFTSSYCAYRAAFADLPEHRESPWTT